MVELKYVKKKKRKQAAIIVLCSSTVGVLIMGIVAFLGRNTGTFTVSLNTANLSLSMSTKKNFEVETTYLRAPTANSFDLYTYSKVKEKFEDIDNENTENSVNNSERLNYFKYSFYVKNTGNLKAGYTLTFNVIDNKLDEKTQRSLLDCVRVVLFENQVTDGEDTHNIVSSKPYARHSLTTSSTSPNGFKDEIIDNSGELATPFLSDTKILETNVKDFNKDDIMRYTALIWLEGDDPEVSGQVPEGASLRLGIEINAYEQNETL